MDGASVLPLRPLTLGELLDAAVALLRRHATVLLAVALVLCAAEQAVLYPLRRMAVVQPPWYFPPYSDRLGEYWLMLGVGFATEAVIIALLGCLTTRGARAALSGEPVRGRRLLSPRGGRFGPALVAALVVGVVAVLASLAGLVPWVVGYGLVGLVVPALVVERAGPFSALIRSVSLSCRAGLRGCGIRLVGYLGWLAIRVALGAGGLAALEFVLPVTGTWVTVLSVGTWIAVNALAYAMLACLDAVLYLETRMRTEGLDLTIALNRRRHTAPDLAVRR
ncbi:MAG TPA: hypothetical protein VK453_11060 [Micromonosporaceae bacterium]|nr:hypothetical protein [Micromonosporaceae bacterium]